MTRNSKILLSGFLVFAITGIVKALAFLKEIIVAEKFGMTGLTDAYNVAFLIPGVLLYFMGLTVLTGLPSSLFSEFIARDSRRELSLSFSTMFNVFFLASLVIALVSIWKMETLIGIYAGGMQREMFDRTVLMGRILITILVTLGMTNYLSSTLNAFRSYVFPGAALVIANAVIIICLLALSARFSIVSLAIGTATGFFLSFIIQFVYIIRSKIRYVFTFNVILPPVKKFILASMPLFLLDITNQICLLIDRKIALGLFEGAFSALVYATRINEIAPNLFILPFMTVLLPEYARDATAGTMTALRSRVRFGAEVLGAIIIFWVVYVGIFHREIVTVFYHRGEFTQSDVLITSRILFINILGMSFHAGYLFLLFLYLGLQKTRSLAVIGVIAYSVNIALIFVLAPPYGVYGLAAASAVMAFVYFLLLFLKLKRSYLPLDLSRSIGRIVKIIAPGAVVSAVYFAAHPLIVHGESLSNGVLAFRIGAAFVLGALFYSGMLKLLGVFSFRGNLTEIFGYFSGQDKNTLH